LDVLHNQLNVFADVLVISIARGVLHPEHPHNLQQQSRSSRWARQQQQQARMYPIAAQVMADQPHPHCFTPRRTPHMLCALKPASVHGPSRSTLAPVHASQGRLGRACEPAHVSVLEGCLQAHVTWCSNHCLQHSQGQLARVPEFATASVVQVNKH
jgi:hypothetical protein